MNAFSWESELVFFLGIYNVVVLHWNTIFSRLPHCFIMELVAFTHVSVVTLKLVGFIHSS